MRDFVIWFAPEHEMVLATLDKSQTNVTGTVTLKLDKGNVIVTGGPRPIRRTLPRTSLSRTTPASAARKNAEGLIRLNALRLRLLGQAARK